MGISIKHRVRTDCLAQHRDLQVGTPQHDRLQLMATLQELTQSLLQGWEGVVPIVPQSNARVLDRWLLPAFAYKLRGGKGPRGARKALTYAPEPPSKIRLRVHSGPKGLSARVVIVSLDSDTYLSLQHTAATRRRRFRVLLFLLTLWAHDHSTGSPRSRSRPA